MLSCVYLHDNAKIMIETWFTKSFQDGLAFSLYLPWSKTRNKINWKFLMFQRILKFGAFYEMKWILHWKKCSKSSNWFVFFQKFATAFIKIILMTVSIELHAMWTPLFYFHSTYHTYDNFMQLKFCMLSI